MGSPYAVTVGGAGYGLSYGYPRATANSSRQPPSKDGDQQVAAKPDATGLDPPPTAGTLAWQCQGTHSSIGIPRGIVRTWLTRRSRSCSNSTTSRISAWPPPPPAPEPRCRYIPGTRSPPPRRKMRYPARPRMPWPVTGRRLAWTAQATPARWQSCGPELARSPECDIWPSGPCYDWLRALQATPRSATTPPSAPATTA